jgi:hypothetical protein
MYNSSTANPPPLDRTQAAVEGASLTQVGRPATTFDTGLLAPSAFTAVMAKKNSWSTGQRAAERPSLTVWPPGTGFKLPVIKSCSVISSFIPLVSKAVSERLAAEAAILRMKAAAGRSESRLEPGAVNERTTPSQLALSTWKRGEDLNISYD